MNQLHNCRSCIKESLKHSKVCPQCKTKITRRDVAADPTMDRVVSKFAAVDDCKNDLMEAMNGLIQEGRGIPEEECRGRTLLREMVLPWVQGVQDDEFKSPSRSFSGSALEELRKNASRSVSPCSKEREEEEGTGDILVQATQDVEGAAETFSRDDAKPVAEKSGQRSIRDMIRSLKGEGVGMKKTTAKEAVVPETPDDEFPISGAAKDGVADILDGLERNLTTEEKKHRTPPGASLPSCDNIVSSAEGSNKENEQAAKTETERASKRRKPARKSTKTVKRARASRTAIEQAKTPTSTVRRIPARLLPWSCMVCTFDNKAGAVECEMCGQSKDADAPSPSPQTLAAQEAIEKQAMKNKRRKRRCSATKLAAETSHMIDSTPQQEDTLEATVDEKEGPSQQQKLTAAKKKKGQKNTSRLCTTAQPTTDEQAPCMWEASIRKSLSKLVVTASGLQPSDKDILKDFCEDSGARYSSAWVPKMTHVVCQADADPPKTVKYLMALLNGCRIVTIDWVKDCMQSKKYASEDKYTVVPENKVAREEYQRLLSAYEIQIQCGAPDMKSGATGLLKSAGAKVVQRMPRDLDKQGLIVVLDHSDEDGASRIVEEAWYRRAQDAHVPVVTHAWLRSSILQGKPVEFDSFLL